MEEVYCGSNLMKRYKSEKPVISAIARLKLLKAGFLYFVQITPLYCPLYPRYVYYIGSTFALWLIKRITKLKAAK